MKLMCMVCMRLRQAVGVITHLALRVTEALLRVTETSVTRYRAVQSKQRLCNALQSEPIISTSL